MNPLYRRAKFLLAVQKLQQLPDNIHSEIGFAGCSNAGKSSVINVLTGIHSLARTSKTPGRTQQIIFFTLDEDRALVDLPGYGFAKVPANVKQHWNKLMQGYFESRQALKGLILVMDIRHPLKEYDLQMLDWAQYKSVSVHILLNKADKLSRGAASSTLHQVRKKLSEQKYTDVSVQTFSALKRSGTETVLQKLDEWFEFNQ